MDNYGYLSDGHTFTISRNNSAKDKQHVHSNELLVEINSRFKPSRKPVYYQRATIALTALVILLLIALIVVLIIWLKPKSKPDLCTSKECIRTAANFKYSMNFTADPCENFYDFCCGKWSKEHPNHGWYTSFSTFTTLTEKIVIETLQVLSKPVKEGDAPLAVNQAKMFYNSCISIESIDALGLAPLYETLQKSNLPIVPNFLTNKKNADFDWVKTEALLKVVLAMDVFIGFTVQSNIYKRNENVIYLGVLYQSCPLPSPVNKRNRRQSKWRKRGLSDDDGDDEEDEKLEDLKIKLRSKIFKFVAKEILKNNSLAIPDGDTLQEAVEVIDNITDYLDDLNENCTLPEGVLDEDETRKFTFKELQDITDNNVESPIPAFWETYIKHIFANTNVTIDPEKDLLYITETETEYLWSVLDFVTSQPVENIELYMWWAAVYAMIINTSSDVASYVLTQSNLYYSASASDGSLYVRSRSLDCCELVTQYMGWAVSYAVADKTFANTTKPKVEKMIDEIKEAFIDHVKGVRWMDGETKKVTLEKSKEMLSLIGFPDWLFKEGALDRKYEGLQINESTYLENMVNVIVMHSTETLVSLRLRNPRDWSTEAITVNAFNSFSDNAINVPMAILNYPLYDLGLEVLNYGSIGSILGHELTHGFDNAGRKHDKYGNYVQWWSNKTIQTFENMTQCFINQYENYTLKGISDHVKGLVTLGENLADNGGLNQAFAAYKQHQQGHGKEAKLPGFEHFSDEQMFFIAYGSIWCESLSTEALKHQIENDEHSPNVIRVIGTLQNSDDFTEAFQCPKSSYMNSHRKKCKIW